MALLGYEHLVNEMRTWPVQCMIEKDFIIIDMKENTAIAICPEFLGNLTPVFSESLPRESSHFNIRWYAIKISHMIFRCAKLVTPSQVLEVKVSTYILGDITQPINLLLHTDTCTSECVSTFRTTFWNIAIYIITGNFTSAYDWGINLLSPRNHQLPRISGRGGAHESLFNGL